MYQICIHCIQSQAQECVFECKVLGSNSNNGLQSNVRAAQEAVVVSMCSDRGNSNASWKFNLHSLPFNVSNVPGLINK